MRVTHALLADYASKSQDGKLNVMGIFDTIFAQSFPVGHPQMYVVLKFEASPAEAGQPKALEIKLLDQDGKQSMGVNATMQIPSHGIPGRKVAMDALFAIQGLIFERPGDYTFSVLVNGDEKEAVTLSVLQMPQQQTPPAQLNGPA